MFCVNKFLKTVMSTVSSLNKERNWAKASHPLGVVMTGTTALRPKTINKKTFKDGNFKKSGKP